MSRPRAPSRRRRSPPPCASPTRASSSSPPPRSSTWSRPPTRSRPEDRDALARVRHVPLDRRPDRRGTARIGGRADAERHAAHALRHDRMPARDGRHARRHPRRRGRSPTRASASGSPIGSNRVLISALDADGKAVGAPSSAPGVLGEIVVSAAAPQGSLRPAVAHRSRRRARDRGMRTPRPGRDRPLAPHRRRRAPRRRRAASGSRAACRTCSSTSTGPVAPVGAEQDVERVPAVRRAAVVGVGPHGLRQAVAVVETVPRTARPGLAEPGARRGRAREHGASRSSPCSPSRAFPPTSATTRRSTAPGCPGGPSASSPARGPSHRDRARHRRIRIPRPRRRGRARRRGPRGAHPAAATVRGGRGRPTCSARSRSPADVARAIDGAEGVVHLAAKVSLAGAAARIPRRERRGDAIAPRRGGARRSDRASSRCPPPPSRTPGPRSPASAPSPPPPSAPAATTRARRPRRSCSRSRRDSAAMRVVAIRPHLVWGPGDTQLVGRIVDRARRGRLPLLNGGTALIDSTYVDNAATGIAAALHRARRGARPGIRPHQRRASSRRRAARGHLPRRRRAAPALEHPRRARSRGGIGDRARVGHPAGNRRAADDPLPRGAAVDRALVRPARYAPRAGWTPSVSIDEGLRRLAHTHR